MPSSSSSSPPSGTCIRAPACSCTKVPRVAKLFFSLASQRHLHKGPGRLLHRTPGHASFSSSRPPTVPIIYQTYFEGAVVSSAPFHSLIDGVTERSILGQLVAQGGATAGHLQYLDSTAAPHLDDLLQAWLPVLRPLLAASRSLASTDPCASTPPGASGSSLSRDIRPACLIPALGGAWPSDPRLPPSQILVIPCHSNHADLRDMKYIP